MNVLADTQHEAAQAAAGLAVLASEAAGEALAAAASDSSIILAGKAVAAMSRIQRRLIERYGVVQAAWLMQTMLERERASDVIVTRSEHELIDEIGGWAISTSEQEASQ